MTLEQSEEKCRNCKYGLELYEEEAKKGRKVMRCEQCGMLHFYVKGAMGKWCLYKATKSEFLTNEEDMSADLINAASFLGLDNNWSLATCALQLQEVAVKLVAKMKGIKLDKPTVERVLDKKIERPSFNEQYEAFSSQVKNSCQREMPILTGDFRTMRTRVLHQGYNPKPEETKSIIEFTIGLLQRLKGISEAT